MLFIDLLLALGLHCWAGFFLVVVSEGDSLVVVCGLLIMVTSFAAQHGPLGAQASVVVADEGSVVAAPGL